VVHPEDTATRGLEDCFRARVSNGLGLRQRVAGVRAAQGESSDAGQVSAAARGRL
jgi:hypothetical protein